MRIRGPLKDLKDSKLILNESKLFPLSSRISLVPCRTFRGLLFPTPVTDQELFLAVSYSKLALDNAAKTEKKLSCHFWQSNAKAKVPNENIHT